MANVLQIRNLRVNIDLIHKSIFQQVIAGKAIEAAFLSSLVENHISPLKKQVENICEKHAATPADMGTPSFRMYLWLRFIEKRDNCAAHVQAVNAFAAILKDYLSARDLKKLLFKIDYAGYLYQRKNGKNSGQLQINEAFIGAPNAIKETIIAAVYAKRRSKRIDRVREYAGSSSYISMNKRISGEPIANKRLGCGKKYDLILLYASLNSAYFDSQLQPLRLMWSSSRSKRRLGYYHPDIHTIGINKNLDDKNCPRLVVDYVLYHEMLHQYFGIEHRNGRRYAHTSAFHQAEAKFNNREEAENLIKLLHNQ